MGGEVERERELKPEKDGHILSSGDSPKISPFSQGRAAPLVYYVPRVYLVLVLYLFITLFFFFDA